MDDNKRVMAGRSGRWEGNAVLKQAMRVITVKRSLRRYMELNHLFLSTACDKIIIDSTLLSIKQSL
jgi:hypothetical protein